MCIHGEDDGRITSSEDLVKNKTRGVKTILISHARKLCCFFVKKGRNALG